MTGTRRWPLSYAQRGRLVRDAERGRVAYNMSADLAVEGRLDPHRLLASLGHLMLRHDLLRGRIDAGEDPERAAWVVGDRPPVPLTVHEHCSAEEIDLAGRTGAAHVFDRSTAPLWRCRLLTGEDGGQRLQFTFDHMVMDARSFAVVLEELDPSGAHPASRPYGEFAELQAARFGSGAAPALKFWQEALAGTAPNRPVLLPFLRDPTGPLSGVVERVSARFTAEERNRLSTMAAGLRTTLFLLLTAGIAAVLARESGDPDVTLRVPTDGRPPGFGRTVGWFANLVHLRLPRAGTGDLAAVAGHTRAVWAAQLRHHDTPYDLVLSGVEPDRRIRGYRPAVVTVNAVRPVAPADALGARLRPHPGGGATYDEAGLHFLVEDGADRLDLHCGFDPHRYPAADLDDLLGRIRHLLLSTA
jgi:hypothetical protein